MISAIRDIIEKTIEEWNNNLESTGHKYRLECKVAIRPKKFYIDKDNFFERTVAELLLFQKKTDPSEKDYLLYRKEVIVPPQMHDKKGRISDDNKRNFTNMLYRTLFYECIGIFHIATQRTIETRDNAEYDIENDRLKPHENAKGMVIKAQVAGPFYEVGARFDVFMIVEEKEKYAVYTQHEAGRANNGIATVPIKDFLVEEATKPSIILLK